MEDEERTGPNEIRSEWQLSRRKKRKKRRARASPEEIRARKRDKRNSRKKGRSRPFVTRKAIHQSGKSKVLRQVFGPGQLKKTQLPTVFSLLDDPERKLVYFTQRQKNW